MKKLNIPLLISLIIGVAYLIYSIVYWGGAVGGPSTGTAAAGAAVAATLVMRRNSPSGSTRSEAWRG